MSTQPLKSPDRHADAWQAVETFLAAIGHPLPNALPRREWLSAFDIILASLSGDEKRWLARKLFSVTKREPKARRLWKQDTYEVQWPTRAQAALTRVFAATPLDPAYAAFKREREKRFLSMLLQDERVQEAYRSWNEYYDLDKKKEFLIYFAASQDKAFSHETFSFLPVKQFFFGLNGEDDGNCQRDLLRMNMGKCRNFLLMCQNMAHEKTHDHERQMALAYRAGKIPVDSPFYRQARLFADYFPPGKVINLFMGPAQYQRGYLRHPVERDARSTAWAIRFLDDRLLLQEKRILWRRRFQAGADILGRVMPWRGGGFINKKLPAPQASL